MLKKMSRAHEGHRTFSIGNPFRTILHRGSHLSPKLRAMMHSFEENLSQNLKNLKPRNAEDVLSLCWMRSAIEFLAEAYAHIKMLINELQFPASDWDEKWIDIYLDSSVKLLDVCNALSSELSQIDQGQLLLQYVLHILDTSKGLPSSEQLRRAHATLHDWIGQVSMINSKFDNNATISQTLQESLCLPKVRKSAKGKVLMRALYGVNVMTIFICSIFATVLSGCLKPLINMPISDKFLWSEAFRDLQSVLSEEIQRQFLCGKARMFKELEAVETYVSRLHVLINTAGCNGEPLQHCNGMNHFKEAIALDRSADIEGEEVKEGNGLSKQSDDISHIEQVTILKKSAAIEGEVLQDRNESLRQCNVEKVMIPEQTTDTEEGFQENREPLQLCNALNHAKEVQITGKSTGTKGEGLVNDQEAHILEKSIDTAVVGSQKFDKPLLLSDGINQVEKVILGRSDDEVGLKECILSLAERVTVLGNELDMVSKQVNYFFLTVMSGRDALLCNFRVSVALEETNPNDATMNG